MASRHMSLLPRSITRKTRPSSTCQTSLASSSRITVYVVLPPPSQTNILFLLTSPIHWQLLVDDFARNGFKVYAPDLFEDDPVPPDALTTVCRPLSPHCPPLALIITQIQGNFDLSTWIGKHGAKHTGERARKVIEGLKGQGITVYGGTGYCYGGTTQTPIRDCVAMLSLFLF